MNDILRKRFDFAIESVEGSPFFYIWVSFLIAVSGLAAYALVMSLILTMHVLEIHIHLVWALMISNYVFLVTASVGLTVVTSIGLIFGVKQYDIIARRGYLLALITIAIGLNAVNLHLGHPERVYNSVLTPNFTSAMFWMTLLYPPYVGLVALTFGLLARYDMTKIAYESYGLRAAVFDLLSLNFLDNALVHQDRDRFLAKITGGLALISGLVAFSVEGTLFAHTEMRAFWYGVEYSPFFMMAAVLSGFSILIAVTAITYKGRGDAIPEEMRNLFVSMGKILAILLGVSLMFTTMKMGIGLLDKIEAITVKQFLVGSFAVPFWGIEIGIGVVLPMFILARTTETKNLAGIVTACLMIIVGLFVQRYDFVVAAQIFPVITEDLPSYFPRILECMLVAGLLAVCLLVYTIADRFLPLKDELA